MACRRADLERGTADFIAARPEVLQAIEDGHRAVPITRLAVLKGGRG
jgi:hypothetical protein